MSKTLTLNLTVNPRQQVIVDFRSNLSTILFIFAIILAYILLSAGTMLLVDNNAVSGNYFTSLYFTVINVTTVGFGDVHPTINSTPGRTVATINAIMGLIIFGMFVAIINLAFQPHYTNLTPPSLTTTFTPSLTITPVKTAEDKLDNEKAKQVICQALADVLAEVLNSRLTITPHNDHYDAEIRTDSQHGIIVDARILVRSPRE
jgi:hypothetical protein